MTISQHDLTRTTLSVLFIAGLIAVTFLILRPFLPALIWTTMIVVATWPLMLRVQAALWGRRPLAVAVMTIALLMVFVIPFFLAVGTVVSNADEIVGWAKSLGTVTLPVPPDWVQALPLIGRKIASVWRKVAASGPEELAQQIAPYAQEAARWLIGELGIFGVMTTQFLLTVVIAAILFAAGETAAAGVRRFGRRLAGAHGESVVNLAGQAIRGVALGVGLTSIVQAVLAGIGLAVAGVPFAMILTVLVFMLCVAQIGSGPVFASAIVWLYWKGDAGWATALFVWMIVVIGVDNVLKPLLIMKSADLPLLLVFTGVVGGLIAFGLVGIFVGPVVLAVAYMLLEAWVRQDSVEGESSNADRHTSIP